MILKQARASKPKQLKSSVLPRLNHLGRAFRLAGMRGAVLALLVASMAGVVPVFAQESPPVPRGPVPTQKPSGRVEVIWSAGKTDGAPLPNAPTQGAEGASGVAADGVRDTSGSGVKTGAAASAASAGSTGQVSRSMQDPPASSSPQAVVRPAADATVEEPWEEEPICPRDQVAPREYSRCLFDATRASEQAMEAALGRALAVISGRSDLAPAQRAAWRTLLEEAQYRFLIFRNFDCQSVAPFEGPRGIGNFEQRSLCLISVNRARAEALEQRYSTRPRPVAAVRQPARVSAPQETGPAVGDRPAAAPPSAPAGPALPAGPEPQSGVWTYPTQPVVD